MADMSHSMAALSADRSNLEERLAREEVGRRHTHAIYPIMCTVESKTRAQDILSIYVIMQASMADMSCSIAALSADKSSLELLLCMLLLLPILIAFYLCRKGMHTCRDN